MSTPNLGLYTVPENTIQQPGVPVNDSLVKIDKCLAGSVAVEFATDADITLTVAQYMTSVLVLTDSPTTLTTGRGVVFPAGFPTMLVVNSTAQTITLKKSGQTGVTVAAGASRRISCGSTDVIAVPEASGVSSVNGASGAVNTFAQTHAMTAAINEARATAIASASTCDIGAVAGNFVHITGTTTITAFGTVQAGTRRVLCFDGSLVLTHNATSLILPTGADITTAAGDTAVMVSEGSGNWRCVGYQRASGAALVGSVTEAVTALSITSGAITLDFSGKSRASFTLALNANVTTVNFSNLAGSGLVTEFDLQITQDGTGGRTFALPAALKALGGSDTAIASAANAVTLLSAKTFDNGTTWRYAMQESA